MQHPEYSFEIWGKPVNVYSGQERDDAYRNLTTFIAEWRKWKRKKFAFWMKFSNEMLHDKEYVGMVIKENFIQCHRDLYAKLFNSIHNLKGNRRRGRRRVSAKRFKPGWDKHKLKVKELYA
jgi:hypothetical protein